MQEGAGAPTANEPPTLIASRYELRRPLGRGGQSDVYLAYDREALREVALKILRVSSETRAYLLKQEFSALAGLDHPNIVRVFEYGSLQTPVDAEAVTYYTMQLVSGADIVTACAGKDMEAVAGLAAQALSALAHVHAHDLLHLDIKPENLLVSGEGDAAKLTLVDFGLARRVREASSGYARGTMAYIAPEMLAGQNIDLRVDLYALGRVLYDALAPGVVLDNVGAPLPWLETLRPDLPQPFCHWIDRLASADIVLRFARAQAALQELSTILPMRDVAPFAANASLLVAPLIGRQSELTHARRLVRTAIAKNKLACIMVTAAAGHGKSRFLSTLQGLCQRDQLRTELSDRRTAEDRLRPEGHRLEDIEERARQLASSFETRRVWLIDDADKLSDVGVDVLSRILNHATALGGVLVVSVTTASATSRWQLLEIENQARLTFVDLGPLSRRDLQLLADALLGNPLPDGWISELHAASAGNPLWAQEILRSWVSEGALAFKDGDFRPQGEQPTPIDRSRLSGLMQARLANIDEDLWPPIFAAAILGRELTPERITRLSAPWIARNDNPAEKVVAMALTAMVQHHIVDHKGDAFRFVHDEIMGALRQLIPEPTRRRLHTEAAQLFRAKKDLDTRDFHLVRGDDPIIAADAGRAAGDRARDAFAHRRAMRRYRRGFKRIEAFDKTRAAVLALCIAECATQIDEHQDALAWFERARTLGGDEREVILRSELGIAEAQRKRCEYKEALDHATRALKLVLAGTVEQANALRLVARIEQHAGAFDRALENFEQALRLYETINDGEGHARVLLDLANLFRERGRIVEAEHHAARAEAEATKLGNDGLRARAYQQLGHVLCLKGDSLLALSHLTESRQLAHVLGDRRTEGAAQRDIATLRRQQGRFAEAKELLERASRLFFLTGARNLNADCLHQLGAIATRMGDYPSAIEALNEGLTIRRDLKDIAGRSHVHVALARVHVDVGLHREGLHYGELALREARKSGDALLGIVAEEAILAAEIAFGTGRPKGLVGLAQRARELGIARVEVSILSRLIETEPRHSHVERLLELGTAADNHEARTHGAWGAGLLHAAAQEAELATADLTSALTLAENAGQTELAARIKSDLGAVFLKLGKRAQAASLLTQAMMLLREHFAALGPKRNTGYLIVGWRKLARDRFRQATE
ncbi:MAG: tetratricopeptide repeat protein [Deltaproteobacteria bacterium]|nr:tetratricopeptide repeat protein [Deltaproteobacteria bacterium]